MKSESFKVSPWTPIEALENDNGITVKVWGREYYFSNEIFPTGIKVLGEEILSSPIRLIGKNNGQEFVWQDKESWIQEKNDRKVVICSAMQSEVIVVSAVTTIEYDGYITTSFKISPRGLHARAGFDVPDDNAKRILDKLWIEIPLKKHIVELQNYGSWDTGVYSGYEKEGFISFRPQNWYGNGDKGLGIYFDSDENWQCVDRASACETFKNEDSYIIRYHLLDSAPQMWEREERTVHYPEDVAKTNIMGLDRTPISYEINLQATPIKPYDESLLKEHIIHIDCFDRIEKEYYDFFLGKVSDQNETIVLDHLKNKGVTTIAVHQNWNRIQGYWQLNENDSKRIHLLIDEVHKRGMKILFYFCNSISTLRPVSNEYYTKNMRLKFNHQPDVGFYRTPPQRCIRCCAKGPNIFEDLTNGMSEFLKDYNADGVYIDSADIPWDCTNEAHGCGYIDEFGIRHATYPMNAMRKAFQKIYEEIHEKLNKKVYVHPANAFVPAFHAYSDVVWNGEQVAFRHKTNTKALLADYNDGFMKTEIIGRNIGVPFQFLAYDLPDDSWNIVMALSIVAPYGAYPRPINIHRALDVMSPVWKVLDSFKAYECSFNPFYGDNVSAKTETEGVKISSYENKNTFVLMVSNPTSDNKEKVNICSNYPALKNIMSGENLKGTNFEISLKPYELTFIECKK